MTNLELLNGAYKHQLKPAVMLKSANQYFIIASLGMILIGIMNLIAGVIAVIITPIMAIWFFLSPVRHLLFNRENMERFVKMKNEETI